MPKSTTSRRKNFNNHSNKVKKYLKTNRTKLSGVTQAFAVGAIRAVRGDYTSQHHLATIIGRAQSLLSELLSYTEKKAANKTVAI